MKALSNQQKLFCQEYLISMNGTQAYLNVYKSVKNEATARTNASRLLTNANIQEYIQELQSKVEEKNIMSAAERMEWLTKVIKGDVKEEIVVNINSENGEMTTKKIPSKLDIKLKAIDTLNKMSGEYKTILGGTVNLNYEEALKAVSDKDEY